MKRITKSVALMLCLGMAFAFAGCEDNPPPSSVNSSSITSSSIVDGSIEDSSSMEESSSEENSSGENSSSTTPDGDNAPSTVTFNTGIDGLTVETVTVAYGASYEWTMPTHAAYNFASWQNNGKNVPIKGVWNIKGNVTLTALWTPKSFVITYEMGDNDKASLREYQQEVRYNAEYVLATPNNLNGDQEFDCWKRKDTGEKFENGVYTLTEDIVLVAHWSSDWSPVVPL